MKRHFPVLMFIAAALLFPYAVTRVFLYTPIEATMGTAQKIFYFHVPLAFVFYILAVTSGVGAIYELRRGSVRGEALSIAAGELAILTGLGVLITGPIWGNATWGRPWTNDARQVMTALIFLQFVALWLIRRYGPSNSQRLAAGLAAFAVPLVPLNYYAVKIWRTTHPDSTVIMSLTGELWSSFWIAFAAYTVISSGLLAIRYLQERHSRTLDEAWIAADS